MCVLVFSFVALQGENLPLITISYPCIFTFLGFATFRVTLVWVTITQRFLMQTQRILILGNGGREYSIGLCLSQDSRVEALYFAPGNGATLLLGKNITYNDNHDIVRVCKELDITLVVVGPEEPLTKGVSDVLRANGIRVFGPSAKAAQLEGSKAFMKDFAMRHNIPTARYIKSSDFDQIKEFITTLTPPIVLKADGLCAGKGVIITKDVDEALETASKMLSGELFGEAGKVLVVEEYLDGFELSVFALSDGKSSLLLNPAQDHKRLLDNDEGPNTGGMGAYTPTPMCDEELFREIQTNIMQRAIDGMADDGMPFCGVLFGGIMVVRKEGKLTPYLLEFNVRFGDPECEVLLPSLETPLLDLLLASDLGALQVRFKNTYSVGVVLASKAYPYTKSEAKPIFIKDFDNSLGHISFAGVELNTQHSIDSHTSDKKLRFADVQNGALLATGGRVLVSVGVGNTLLQARENAYKIIESIHFEGMQYRSDIAMRGIKFLDS